MLGKSPNGPAFACRIASLDKDGNSFSAGLNPSLEPNQFNLKRSQFLFLQERFANLLEINILSLQ